MPSAGPQLEAAWRARHKWAAQRAGRVLTDVYDSPPLQPLMTAAQKLSIGLVLLANGTQEAAGLPAGMGATGIGSAWGACSSASSWMLTASIPAGWAIVPFPLPCPLPPPSCNRVRAEWKPGKARIHKVKNLCSLIECCHS